MPCFTDPDDRPTKKKDIDWYERLKSMDYDEKVHYSKSMIREALRKHKDWDRVMVGCSFGKDSTVMVHLVRTCGGLEVPIIFCNTGVELKETLQFRDRLVDLWRLNYFELYPDISYWDIVKESGYPPIRFGSKKGGVPKCCYHLKEKPVRKYVNSQNVSAMFVGLMASESYTRKWLIIRYSDHYRTKKNYKHEVDKYLPLGFWTDEDVWRYIEENNLPINEAYSKYNIQRTGCAPCTAYISWEKEMAKTNYKLYEKIQKDKGVTLITSYGG